METMKKQLKDLNLLDRFLFSQAMEDPVIMRNLLEIILGRDVTLKCLPQTEKEQRISPLNRFVKLDVWGWDTEGAIYDAEVQKENTGNLPKRSRLYQGMIDSRLLEPGEVDFNHLNDVYVIIIAPFDLFGYGKYRYTFDMQCREVPQLSMGDGAVRIFLNTHGKNEEEVSKELVELLRYMENTTVETSGTCESQRIREMQERIAAIKSSEEIGVKYMQEWEEKIIEKRKAREEGLAEGREEGRKEGRKAGLQEGIQQGIQQGLNTGKEEKLLEQIRKKLSKGQSTVQIADALEEDENIIIKLVEKIQNNEGFGDIPE